jgi:tetratricopeptide (TPR) repeat protein
MSRFSNLEFDGDQGEEQQRRASAVPEVDFHLAEARHAFENAEFEKALRACAKAIQFNPHHPAAWIGQVQALIELGEFNEASVWADKALERFPSEPELLAAKAVALGRQGDLEGALAFSDASVQERGETAYVWLARGDVLLTRKEKRADFCFDKALLIAARDWFTAWMAARIRAFHRQYAVALKLVHQSIELRADHAVLWLFAGNCQRELGLLGAARTSFQQALDLDAQLLPARHALVALDGVSLGTRVQSWWRRILPG